MSGGDRAIRVTTAAVVLGVAAVAAVISYGHAHALVLRAGEAGATGALLPLTIDGLILCASLTLLDSARRGRKAPALAWPLLALGILATLTANCLHGLSHGVLGAIVAAWPALALVGSTELLMRMIRIGRPAPARAAESTPEGAPEVYPDALPALPAVPDAVVRDARAVMEAEEFAEQIEAGKVPSIRRIRGYLGSGQERAKRAHEFITAHAT